MDRRLAADLRMLQMGTWADDGQVRDIATAVRTYVDDQDLRVERLDKVEEILNKLEADGNVEVLKHFEALKVEK